MRIGGVIGGVAGGRHWRVPVRRQAQFDVESAVRDASDVAVNVASGDLGELFEYRFSTPVTVKKDESTMLPFLQQPIGARKLLIYSENYGEHPMNAAELNNSTAEDAGWRPDHRLRCRQLCRRSPDDDAQSRRQAVDQLLRRSWHACHHANSIPAANWCARFMSIAAR